MSKLEELFFRSNGKLLITSEYLVLDGAEALALPTKKGQTLSVYKNNSDVLEWKSFTVDGNIWFEGVFDENFESISNSENQVSSNLSIFLKIASMLNPNFASLAMGNLIETHLEFPQSWGLGSSSTLINNIAQWANVDPFVLQQESFPGSGYDIACTFNDTPIIYRIVNRDVSYITTEFYPSFADKLFFVHLNKKQNSRDGIKKYREFSGDKNVKIDLANSFTEKFIECNDISEFRKLLALHESLISDIINEKPVKQKLFPDFKGSIKSLGAWGGDFVLATGDNVETYFKSKGYKMIIPFNEMIKQY